MANIRISRQLRSLLIFLVSSTALWNVDKITSLEIHYLILIQSNSFQSSPAKEYLVIAINLAYTAVTSSLHRLRHRTFYYLNKLDRVRSALCMADMFTKINILEIYMLTLDSLLKICEPCRRYYRTYSVAIKSSATRGRTTTLTLYWRQNVVAIVFIFEHARRQRRRQTRVTANRRYPCRWINFEHCQYGKHKWELVVRLSCLYVP